MVLKHFLQVYRVLYCRSALHMVGSGTRRVVRVVKIRCALYVLVLRSKFFYWFPGIREPPLATRLVVTISVKETTLDISLGMSLGLMYTCRVFISSTVHGAVWWRNWLYMYSLACFQNARIPREDRRIGLNPPTGESKFVHPTPATCPATPALFYPVNTSHPTRIV